MKDEKDRLRPIEKSDNLMRTLWILFIAAGLFLLGFIIHKVFTYTPDQRILRHIQTQTITKEVVPTRGDILDCKGRILATSTFVYEARLDCTVADSALWDKEINALAQALSGQFKDKSSGEYLAMLKAGRKNKNRYLLIGKDLTQIEINSIHNMPILKKGRFKGGYMEFRKEKRLYPYGSAARRTIGYVKDNEDSSTTKGIGVEIARDNILHGVNGTQVMRKSDYGMITVKSPNNRKAHDGHDVRLTIDVDIQKIAEKALRETIENNELIEKSCVIILETNTGAVKAMVNLGRDDKYGIGEWDNYAIRTAEAPGSVFKGAVVMAMLEEGYLTSLDTEIPTYGGVWIYNGETFDDKKHVGRDKFPGGKIKVREAFEMSANNPFRQMICDERTFGNNPARFVDKIKSLGLVDTIDFDLIGATPPFILDPSMKKMGLKGAWDRGTFARMAIGYMMELSPLNLVCFYNAIATGGRMMKPYLIEAEIENGKEVKSYGPIVMHEKICRESTADTLKRMMSLVANDKNGTAYWQLKDAVCPIAGKTGTAQRVFKKSNGKYGTRDTDGTESQQGSFVGFFPNYNPEYTAIVVVWGKPSQKNLYGATWAAPVFRKIADKIYCLNDNVQ